MAAQKQSQHKGWICLDIDGTVTDQILSIPKPVLDFLKQLQREHWKMAFVTGRMFSLAVKTLKSVDFPYSLAVENGASWYEMPEGKLKEKNYLPVETFLEAEPFLENSSLDFVFVSGREDGNQCFYRPDHLNLEMVRYFKEHLSTYAGTWKAVSSFRDLCVRDFPYAKIYGSKDELEKVLTSISKIQAIKTHLVQDSVNPKNYIIQLMSKDVNKGKVVLSILNKNALKGPVISAGNDLNDLSLLSIADIKIAMQNSPKKLLEISNIIAPPVGEMGIIPALKIATKQIESL